MHHVAIQYPSLLLMYEYLSYLSSIQLCNVSQGDMLLKYNVCAKKIPVLNKGVLFIVSF